MRSDLNRSTIEKERFSTQNKKKGAGRYAMNEKTRLWNAVFFRFVGTWWIDGEAVVNCIALQYVKSG